MSASVGTQVAFWTLSILAVGSALMMLVSRKAVHAALWVALAMINLAGLYVMQGAVFLGVVQVVVYTGAIMMLFLFVLMLVGVDASDSLVETLRGQRVAGVLLGLGFGVLLIGLLSRATLGDPVRALRLAAAAESVRDRSGAGAYVFAMDRDEPRDWVEGLRARLNPAEAARVWAEGYARSGEIVGAGVLVDTGESASPSGGSVVQPLRSVGGNRATPQATRLLTRSTGSSAASSPSSPVSESIRVRCPPALPPTTPSRLASTP